MEELCTRYLHSVDISDRNDITKEDLENLKQDLMNAQRKLSVSEG